MFLNPHVEISTSKLLNFSLGFEAFNFTTYYFMFLVNTILPDPSIYVKTLTAYHSYDVPLHFLGKVSIVCIIS